MRCFYLGNQSGLLVTDFYLSVSEFLSEKCDVDQHFLVWTDNEKRHLISKSVSENKVFSFESFVNFPINGRTRHHRCLEQDYPEIEWASLIASERSFTDYSFLFGSSGERKENFDYINRLLINITEFLESKLNPGDLLITQTADTLFTLVGINLAKSLKVKSYSIAPAWLHDTTEKGGGLLVDNEFLRCKVLEQRFEERISAGIPLTSDELLRVNRLKDAVKKFDGKSKYYEKTGKNSKTGKMALTPNFLNLPSYFLRNKAKNKDIYYPKPDFRRKIKANFLRLIRSQVNRDKFGSNETRKIPPKSVFFGMHYQPEQTTLVQGLWFANQISLIEDISKSLPLGYTLVVKEHPWGRGNRPSWQYRHLASFYNVMLVDAPSKELIKNSDAVISISGTIAIESVILEKPTIVLGQNSFTFCDVFYRIHSISALPSLLKEILIKKEVINPQILKVKLDNLLIAYLQSLVNAYPLQQFSEIWADALGEKINENFKERSRSIE